MKLQGVTVSCSLRRVVSCCAISLLLGIGGCGHKASESEATAPGNRPGSAPISKSGRNEFNYDDPCSLLEPKEVEAVLGASLGTPPYRAKEDGQAAPNGDHCVYQTADFHILSVEVEFKDGATTYGMVNFGKKLLGAAPGSLKKALKLSDGTELTGEWDEATLVPMNCCQFAALRGDQYIEMDFTGSEATITQAAKLVDSAFKRIDTPLKIDGSAGVDAAIAYARQRPREVDPCSLLSRSEVESTIGALSADPVRDGTYACTYQLPPIGNSPRPVKLVFRWRGGYAEWRSNAHLVAGAAQALSGGMKSVEEAVGNQAVAASDAWERAGIQGVEFVAVKKDVLVKVELDAIDEDGARKLVAAVMRKI